jgi:hypothetical protein
MGRENFLSTLGYRIVGRRRQWVMAWWGKLLICLLLGGLLFLCTLLLAKHDKTFQPASAYLVFGAWLFFSVAWIWWNAIGRRVTGWLGMDMDAIPGNGWIVWVIISMVGSLFIPLYVLMTYAGPDSTVVTAAPAVVGFSIPIVGTMLAALAITAANYPKIAREHRAELLRVAQKFVVATVSFILFVIVFSFLLAFQKQFGVVDPNEFAFGAKDIYGGVLFWMSALSLFLGSGLFILGAGELVSVLVKLRNVWVGGLRRGRDRNW